MRPGRSRRWSPWTRRSEMQPSWRPSWKKCAVGRSSRPAAVRWMSCTPWYFSCPREASRMTCPWKFPLLAVLLLEIAFPRVASPAGTFASLPEMALLEAEDHLDVSGASSLLEGYLALGLGREAAASLERRIRLGEFPRPHALEVPQDEIDALLQRNP